jgi:CheY-like chemotaxis protein
VALVLCVGPNPLLMHTRMLILEREGHTVVGAMNDPELKEACAKHSFDIAVIGQSMSRKMKQSVAALVRENCPSVKILELYLPYEGPYVSDANSWLAVPTEGPHELTERVNELTREKGKNA